LGGLKKNNDAAGQDSRLLGEDLKTATSNNRHIYLTFVKEV